jgi:hypothetical protein
MIGSDALVDERMVLFVAVAVVVVGGAVGEIFIIVR